MSELLFLGTGAADWDIDAKDSFVRRFSAALLNDELLIDCNLHIFHFMESTGNESLFDKVTDIIITHSHGDHFKREAVLKIAEKQKVRVACDANIARQLEGQPNIELIVLKPFVPVTVGNYSVMPLLANHDIVCDGDSFAFHFIITAPDGKKVFYGLDGAWFLRPSWQEMLKHKYDVMVFDCTVGDSHDWRIFEHNTVPMLRIMLEEIRQKELVAEGGKLVASHLARTLHAPLDDTVEMYKKMGMLTAFDGMKITL